VGEKLGPVSRGGKMGLPLASFASPKKMFHAVSKLALRGGASVTLAVQNIGRFYIS